jgi:hypothetical protein
VKFYPYRHKLKRGEEYATGVTVTPAIALLLSDIACAEHEVNVLVKVTLTQEQSEGRC